MPLPRHVPELATLDLLVSVATTGSLGRAAVLHGITQPAASQRLQTLERRVGLPLLVRTPAGSHLTPAGESVVEWARPVLEAAEQLATGVDALRGSQSDRVLVAASLTIADELFPRWLAALQQQDAGAVVSLRVANSATVVELVRAGTVAVGFVEGPSAPADLRARTVGHDELVVVVRRGHPWAARRRPLPAATLAAARLAVREPGSGTREAFEQALAACGLEVHAGLELGSTAALKAVAVAGEEPAVLSRLSVAPELADGRLAAVAVDGVDLRRTLRAVWSRDHPPAGNAAALVAVAARAGVPGGQAGRRSTWTRSR
ncbi:MAG TPA: LysR substrate-binding domain-containing protein [Mycobacteriales bacterium]